MSPAQDERPPRGHCGTCGAEFRRFQLSAEGPVITGCPTCMATPESQAAMDQLVAAALAVAGALVEHRDPTPEHRDPAIAPGFNPGGWRRMRRQSWRDQADGQR